MQIESSISLFKILDAKETAMTIGLYNAGKLVVELASQLAPVSEFDREHLKDSGKVEIVGIEEVEVSFGNDLPDIRAVAQEFGTVEQPAQPYLTPAVTQIDATLECAKEFRKRLR